MRAPVVSALLGGAIACGSTTPKLWPAGAKEDDGHGLLARASTRFMTDDRPDDDLFGSSARRGLPIELDETGGDPSGGAGGSGYGGASYANFTVPSWPAPSADRKPRYAQAAGLSGVIEGVVSWRGAPPPKLTTTCGAIDGLAVGSGQAVAGVLVYIERVQIGRTLLNEGKPAAIGGVVVKRGCALAPAVQIVTPLPAALAIHGDTQPARFRITSPSGGTQPFELQEGGRLALQVQPGVTRVDAEDGTVSAAWIVAVDTPYYAITDDRGRFRIDELGAGTYEVTIWQPPIPAIVKGGVTYGAPVIVHRTVTVDVTKPARLDVALGR